MIVAEANMVAGTATARISTVITAVFVELFCAEFETYHVRLVPQLSQLPDVPPFKVPDVTVALTS